MPSHMGGYAPVIHALMHTHAVTRRVFTLTSSFSQILQSQSYFEWNIAMLKKLSKVEWHRLGLKQHKLIAISRQRSANTTYKASTNEKEIFFTETKQKD